VSNYSDLEIDIDPTEEIPNAHNIVLKSCPETIENVSQQGKEEETNSVTSSEASQQSSSTASAASGETESLRTHIDAAKIIINLEHLNFKSHVTVTVKSLKEFPHQTAQGIYSLLRLNLEMKLRIYYVCLVSLLWENSQQMEPIVGPSQISPKTY
jgi:hypothetical protein